MEEEERKSGGSRWRRRRRRGRIFRISAGGIDLRLAIFSLAHFVLVGPSGGAIGCFVCSSVNGSNPNCEDTFNSSVFASVHGSVGLFQQPCWAFRKNRKGLFPADHCIKVSGHRYDHPNHTLMIRTCALDSGSLTADTEIVRISHCGHFKFKGNHYAGRVI
ncbi:hypothetical protein niasHT_007644 [Heterodera trifolii]|uniref:Uncharacterized protein n=1 Tax=Heterodera trifolii TaxID=157864 RepID=A0ABD2LPT0_9BILA